MAFPKNSKSAFLALVAAGGVWAWQNRDKVSAWAGQLSQQQPSQRKTIADEVHTSTAQPYSTVEPYTGGTRRIGDEANEI
jgi:hypothetical protein